MANKKNTSPTTASGVWALEDVVIDTKWQITIRGAADSVAPGHAKS